MRAGLVIAPCGRGSVAPSEDGCGLKPGPTSHKEGQPRPLREAFARVLAEGLGAGRLTGS